MVPYLIKTKTLKKTLTKFLWNLKLKNGRKFWVLPKAFTEKLILHVFENSIFSGNGRNILYHPVMLSSFLPSLGNYTRRAIFPEMCKINQSSVDFHGKPLGWLLDWLTKSWLWLDWFIGFVPPDRFLREAGLKWLNITGIMQCENSAGIRIRDTNRHRHIGDEIPWVAPNYITDFDKFNVYLPACVHYLEKKSLRCDKNCSGPLCKSSFKPVFTVKSADGRARREKAQKRLRIGCWSLFLDYGPQ